MKKEKRKKKKIKKNFFLLFYLFFFLLPAAGLFAQEEEVYAEELPPIEIRLETNPANPTVNNPWSVFILVNHPRPDEVSVDAADFPSSLALERIRTDTRTILGTGVPETSSPETGFRSERWTRVEFLFTPRMAEAVRLGPFEVRIQERFAVTEVINVRVQGESTGRYEPRFRWVAPPAGLRLGEVGEITLELTNWDPARRTPVDFFRGRAPLNAILEENPPERTTASAGEAYRYRIVLIPLEGGSVKLEAFSFVSDTYTLSVPEISLPVLSARQVAAPAVTVEEGDKPPDFAGGPTLPQEGEGVLFLWRSNEIPVNFFSREYQEIMARVEALWVQNRWAESLAEIRKNERDSIVGPSLVSIRREMEGALGLGVTEDEGWRPFGVSRFLPVALLCIVLLIAVAALIDLKSKNVTIRKRYGFTFCIVCVFIMLLVFNLPEGNAGLFPPANYARAGKIAVLKRTQSYRVPDYNGAVNDWFSEGQPVTVGDFSGDWCFAETLDGRSGWVERDSVINY